MDISVKPGTYVIAVSGGVDSMVLLHLLMQTSERLSVSGYQPPNSKQDKINLIVAHFDHGIRSDSPLDRRLAQEAARHYGLRFVYDEGGMGAGASEELARKARYKFLRTVQQASNADAVITAHHWDDALETAIINMIRGTNRRGLSALRSKSGLLRPFVDNKITKSQIIDYAQHHGIVWNEDSTNADTKYLRNYIRRVLLPRFEESEKQKLSDSVRHALVLNDQIDQLIGEILASQPASNQMDRRQFIGLPHAVAREVLAAWLRITGVPGVDSYAIERLVVACKTYHPGKRADISGGRSIIIKKAILEING